MNHLNRVFNTALALQGARSFSGDMQGMIKLPEAEEFAKALREALIGGFSPSTVTDQVSLAMGGNF